MSRFPRISILLLLLLGGFLGQLNAASAPACENMSKLALAHTRVTSAQVVPAGTFVSPISPGPGVPSQEFKDVPAFCRVMADISPTADSDIKLEVWLPLTGWNSKFQGQGNGGFAGQIGYGPLGVAVKHGYAAAGTDTGHSGDVLHAPWALGHPEKIVDFGYRAVHEMTVDAQAIIDAFYGRKPRYSYFESCSNGGRQALMEAQRFPADYNGIVAGAPANNWTKLFAAFAWDESALLDKPGNYIPGSKLPAIRAAVLAACDARDGIADGILNDPRKCDFDPRTLLCKGAESDACLSAPQVETLKKLYAGPHDSRGHRIYGGLMPGSEEGWGGWVMGASPGSSVLDTFTVQYFSNMVANKKDWDLKEFNPDESVQQADAATARILNATNPDLKPFMARGGKLIMYQGWSDQATTPLNSVDYYDSVVRRMGQQSADRFLRLYMAPGMEHCGGGLGPNYFGQDGDANDHDPDHDMYAAIEAWVEKDVAPAQIIATKYEKDSKTEHAKMTRPLCPFPQIAKYKGTGDVNDAANFTCTVEEK